MSNNKSARNKISIPGTTSFRTHRRRILFTGALKPVLARATAVYGLVGADTVFIFPSTASGPIEFVERGGPILATPSIKPIFWGAEWGRPNPPISPTLILDAMGRIISGPYLNSLGQYGIGSKPTVQGPMYVLDSEPPSGTPTAQQLSTATGNLLNRLIDDDQLPEPDENWVQFNVIFLPSTVPYPLTPKGPVAGPTLRFSGRITTCWTWMTTLSVMRLSAPKHSARSRHWTWPPLPFLMSLSKQ